MLYQMLRPEPPLPADSTKQIVFLSFLYLSRVTHSIFITGREPCASQPKSSSTLVQMSPDTLCGEVSTSSIYIDEEVYPEHKDEGDPQEQTSDS
ncbi:hypothetical protein AFLA_013272 [Aspergillus flavus NRRL3357]|nr:hypothetical protein AFLA_013272 [Aspergillus flavus NRRL3357]